MILACLDEGDLSIDISSTVLLLANAKGSRMCVPRPIPGIGVLMLI